MTRAQIGNQDEKKKLGLYLHIPFCVKKCNYCDFLSAPADENHRQCYVNALCSEICFWGERMKEYTLDSIFFGGGTPSILTGKQIDEIMECIKKSFSLDEDAEITIECNPKTADLKKLRMFRQAGINRLSIGLQSADNSQLQTLGRIHSYEDFLKTWEDSRQAGFENRSIDIMSALPGQRLAELKTTLENVLNLKPEHLSVYSLIIEENTPFYESYKDGKGLPGEEESEEMDLLIHHMLGQSGYRRYEISNYAKAGYESRHNLKYWNMDEYLGLGIGASSYFHGIRFKIISDTAQYCEIWNNKKDPLSQWRYGDWEQLERIGLFEETEHLSLKDEMEEFAFLGLRKADGFSITDFERRFQVSFSDIYMDTVKRYQKLGLLKKEQDRIFLTEQGLELSNQIMADFILT